MKSNSTGTTAWDKQQAELWDRIFQVTQDVADLAGTVTDSRGGSVVRDQMVEAAMGVGLEVVRANASATRADFTKYVAAARLSAIETDYWIRMVYMLQQQDDNQQEISSLITQYAALIDLLQRLSRSENPASAGLSRSETRPQQQGQTLRQELSRS